MNGEKRVKKGEGWTRKDGGRKIGNKGWTRKAEGWGMKDRDREVEDRGWGGERKLVIKDRIKENVGREWKIEEEE